MHWLLVYFYVFDVSFGLALLLTPVCKRLAVRLGCVDQPDLERKIHTQAMPLLGGFAVFVAFALNVLFNYLVVVLAAAHLNLPDDLSIHVAGVLSVWPKLVVLLVGGLLMVMLGAYTTYIVQDWIRLHNPGLFGWSLAIALPLAFVFTDWKSLGPPSTTAPDASANEPTSPPPRPGFPAGK